MPSTAGPRPTPRAECRRRCLGAPRSGPPSPPPWPCDGARPGTADRRTRGRSGASGCGSGPSDGDTPGTPFGPVAVYARRAPAPPFPVRGSTRRRIGRSPPATRASIPYDRGPRGSWNPRPSWPRHHPHGGWDPALCTPLTRGSKGSSRVRSLRPLVLRPGRDSTGPTADPEGHARSLSGLGVQVEGSTDGVQPIPHPG